MVLTKQELDAVMDEQQQKEEIQRIKEAPECLVLYKTFMADKKTANICETLLKLSGCAYHESLLLSRGIVKWVKGNTKLNYEAF